VVLSGRDEMGDGVRMERGCGERFGVSVGRRERELRRGGDFKGGEMGMVEDGPLRVE